MVVWLLKVKKYHEQINTSKYFLTEFREKAIYRVVLKVFLAVGCVCVRARACVCVCVCVRVARWKLSLFEGYGMTSSSSTSMRSSEASRRF